MNARNPLLKFGIFTLIALAFSAWLVVLIGNVSFQDRNTFTAEFTDVTGLLPNDNVKIAGVTVGKVTAIEAIPGGTALVTFSMDADVAVPEDSLVEVRWRDVMALRFLYLTPGTGLAVDSGHRFPLGQTSAPADFNVLLEKLTPVMRALDPALANQVVEAFQVALIGRVDEVRDLISDGAALTQALAGRDDEVRRLLSNAAIVVEAYASREQQLRSLLDSFADVATTVAARNDVLTSSVTALADAQAELRRLLAANDVELRAALDELDAITQIVAVNHTELDHLLATTGQGLVSYHRISSIGQFFNINAVGVSYDEEAVASQRGGQLPPTSGVRRSRSLAPLFLPPPATAEAR